MAAFPTSLAYSTVSLGTILLLVLTLTSLLTRIVMEVPDEQTVNTKDALVTIFTTFKEVPQRDYVQSNTILNWASLGPEVRCLLFTDNSANDSLLVHHAQVQNWMLAPLQKRNRKGMPFLKNMYTAAESLARSAFYGFANGDISFDNNITETLLAIHKQFIMGQRPVLVVGWRMNVPIRKAGNIPLYSSREVQQFAEMHGKLAKTDSIDYFFIWKPSLFPWGTFKDIVVASPGFDSHIMDRANRGGLIFMDATRTVLALHQTGKDGDFSSELAPDAKAVRKGYGHISKVYGWTTAIQHYTVRDKYGHVQVKYRSAH